MMDRYTKEITQKVLSEISSPSLFRGRSMWPTLKPGDLIFLKPESLQTLIPGDIVLYRFIENSGYAHRLLYKKKVTTGYLIKIKGDASRFGEEVFCEEGVLLQRVVGFQRGKGRVCLWGSSSHLRSVGQKKIFSILLSFWWVNSHAWFSLRRLLDPALRIPPPALALKQVRQKFGSPEEIEACSALAEKGFEPWEEEVVSRFLKPGDRLLDLGCGAGRASFAFARIGCRVVGIDFVEGMIQKAQRQKEKLGLDVDFLCMEATRLGFQNKTFDLVFSNQGTLPQLLPTSKRRVAFLKEVHRVLKEQGRFAFRVYYQKQLVLSKRDCLRRLRRFLFPFLGTSEPGDRLVGHVSEKSNDQRLCFIHLYRSPTEVALELEAACLEGTEEGGVWIAGKRSLTKRVHIKRQRSAARDTVFEPASFF